MWSSLWSMGCITSHGNIFPLFYWRWKGADVWQCMKHSFLLAAGYFQGTVAGWFVVLFCFFNKRCWGTVPSLNVYSMALGHLSALKRRRDLQVLTSTACCNPQFCQCLLCFGFFYLFCTSGLSAMSLKSAIFCALPVGCYFYQWNRENAVRLNLPINDNDVIERW